MPPDRPALDRSFFRLPDRSKLQPVFIHEARIELFKQLSNLRLDFVQRLYDRRSIAERYLIFVDSIHTQESSSADSAFVSNSSVKLRT